MTFGFSSWFAILCVGNSGNGPKKFIAVLFIVSINGSYILQWATVSNPCSIDRVEVSFEAIICVGIPVRGFGLEFMSICCIGS